MPTSDKEPSKDSVKVQERPAWRDRELFNWARSASIGGVSEIAVLAPIRRGCPPGDRRTYEQVARAAIGNLAARHAQGLPTELGKLSTIHFGRIIVLRPEHYLTFSADAGIGYEEERAFEDRASEGAESGYRASGPAAVPSPRDPAGDNAARGIPNPLDDFEEIPPEAESDGSHRPTPSVQASKVPPTPYYRSWILTLVEFDGDLKVYMRDIARSLNGDFDAIFKNCEAYPGAGNYEAWWSWIRKFQINVDLFYATYPDLSVVRIKQLEAFKRRFDAFVARVRSPTGPRVRSMDELFDEFLAENQQFATNFPSPGGLFPAFDDKAGG